MKISDVEKKVKVSKQTIIYYEKEGLLQPKRDENDFRIFDDEDIRQLETIIQLRSFDISIDDIRLILQGKVSLQEILDITSIQLEEEMEIMKRRVDLIQVIKEKELPVLKNYKHLSKQTDGLKLGYFKTNKTPSLGRRMTRKLAWRRLLNVLLFYLLFGVFLSAIVSMIDVTLPPIVGMLIIGAQILCNMILIGYTRFSSDIYNRNNYIEFLEDGVRYYKSNSFFKDVRYWISALFKTNASLLTFCTYTDIQEVEIQMQRKILYFGFGPAGFPYEQYNFTFTLAGNKLQLRNPFTAADDRMLIANILKRYVSNVTDAGQFIEKYTTC
ncbi:MULTISPECIES: MerR family transcriptional regulator [unclassified Breznakia]|uniref:MerR family transcriptional regulator n=1 Tax=unclassified Breznakia TaxID=2623764 RepID=UPI0024755533|nr:MULTISPECIES: MerR family transcriptional regulator [unclassified Breznakia]MDH6367030.1 DNA-binding transcriptional MerR regulator [Breznakia sp. PH1-1]MDH6404198.1 DNA-binding transcriptional MerR regulator [Breznakia sp. PF1-11]MDH6411917.1 DNA-binding transcriptional MerR regulator [Breznakia sp. PFB1-11]MDH6414186.1 DNA-binding transcriptional MerR regulator [Breznakia sp. PFB1-14]MDH6415991.1 DNA-binding transcriptional MerR regulator [Breznakia sp. PFB1-4]